MKALVTGGGGFLGSHIVRRLLERGDEVRVLGRSEYPELVALGVECVRGDVRDADAVQRAVDGTELVFHVAARVGYWGDHAEYVDTNVGGAQNMVDACREAGIRRLVYTSSPSVVIGPKGGIDGGDESVPYPSRYLSSYGPTKAEAERLILGADEPGGLRTAALRPHFIFGPRDPQIAPRLVLNARRGSLAQVGDGSNQVDVTYIDNAVDAHVQVGDDLAEAKTRAGGQAYFIGNPEPVKLWRFVARVLEGLGAPPVRKRLPFGAAWTVGAGLEGVYRLLRLGGEPPLTRMAAVILGTSHYFTHAKAERDFGYRPAVDTEEGLRRLFHYHAEHPIA